MDGVEAIRNDNKSVERLEGRPEKRRLVRQGIWGGQQLSSEGFRHEFGGGYNLIPFSEGKMEEIRCSTRSGDSERMSCGDAKGDVYAEGGKPSLGGASGRARNDSPLI